MKKIFVKNILCDNAGENVLLKKLCVQQMIDVTFEFTAPGSPQYNGKVERKFATLFGKVRSILNAARLTKDLQQMMVHQNQGGKVYWKIRLRQIYKS